MMITKQNEKRLRGDIYGAKNKQKNNKPLKNFFVLPEEKSEKNEINVPPLPATTTTNIKTIR